MPAVRFVPGKLTAQHVTATDAAGDQPCCRLFFVLDRLGKHRFLVDTGAEVSVVPRSFSSAHHQPTAALKAANGSMIKTYGHHSRSLDLGLKNYILGLL